MGKAMHVAAMAPPITTAAEAGSMNAANDDPGAIMIARRSNPVPIARPPTVALSILLISSEVNSQQHSIFSRLPKACSQRSYLPFQMRKSKRHSACFGIHADCLRIGNAASDNFFNRFSHQESIIACQSDVSIGPAFNKTDQFGIQYKLVAVEFGQFDHDSSLIDPGSATHQRAIVPN